MNFLFSSLIIVCFDMYINKYKIRESKKVIFFSNK